VTPLVFFEEVLPPLFYESLVRSFRDLFCARPLFFLVDPCAVGLFRSIFSSDNLCQDNSFPAASSCLFIFPCQLHGFPFLVAVPVVDFFVGFLPFSVHAFFYRSVSRRMHTAELSFEFEFSPQFVMRLGVSGRLSPKPDPAANLSPLPPSPGPFRTEAYSSSLLRALAYGFPCVAFGKAGLPLTMIGAFSRPSHDS